MYYSGFFTSNGFVALTINPMDFRAPGSSEWLVHASRVLSIDLINHVELTSSPFPKTSSHRKVSPKSSTRQQTVSNNSHPISRPVPQTHPTTSRSSLVRVIPPPLPPALQADVLKQTVDTTPDSSNHTNVARTMSWQGTS